MPSQDLKERGLEAGPVVCSINTIISAIATQHTSRSMVTPPSIVAGEHEQEEIDAAVCRAAGDPRICVWTRRLSLSQSAPSEKCLK